MRMAFTKDGEKTDLWWDAYDEGYEDALRDLETRTGITIHMTRRKE